MEKYVIYPEQSIKDISEAIKEKRGIASDRNFTVPQMPAAIRSINSGSKSSGTGGRISTPIELGIELDLNYPATHAIDPNTAIYLISSDKFDEINNYFNQGGYLLVDNNGSVFNISHMMNVDWDIKIVKVQQTGSYIVTRHCIVAWHLKYNESQMISSWVTAFLTDNYTEGV